jgi:putative peptidoglycan lipid II flippase
MALLRFAATVGGYTLISRVLGFLRDILIARYIGVGLVADAFFVAFKLPNLFRRLFAEGAFNLAFVPLFAGRMEADGKRAALRFAEQALAVLFWVLVLFTVAAEIAMPWLLQLFAPGFVDEPDKYALTVQLARLTFPYLLLISLVSLFAAAAAAPILLNLCLIASLLFFAERLETPGHALAWAVSVAGMAQLLWMAWNCQRAGLLPALRMPRLSPDVRRLLVLIAPAALGAGVQQLNLIVDIIIASLLPTGSVSYLYYADRIVQLPLGVVGVAMGTVLLPTLSRAVGAGDEGVAHERQNRALEFALLLTLPAAAALAVIAMPVISVLFERGAFTVAATSATAGALAAYALGLPAFVLVKVLVPGYFARQDTRTPLAVAAVCLVVNVVLNLLLMGPFAHVGIALASSLSSWLNAGLLAVGLFLRGHLRFDARLRARLPRMLLAAVAMAALLWVAATVLTPWLQMGLAVEVAVLAALVALGLACFGLLAHLLGAARAGELRAALKR